MDDEVFARALRATKRIARHGGAGAGEPVVLYRSRRVCFLLPESATVVRLAPADEEKLYRVVTDAFPNISTIRVKDAIAQVNGLLQQLSDGMRAASLLTILSGLLVLAGAIAAGSRSRLYDATVLKVLGATRARIASVYIIEYGALGFLTGLLALCVGTLAASLICRQVLDVPLEFDFGVAALTVLGGGTATLVFGLAGAWTALSARPAAQLRSP